MKIGVFVSSASILDTAGLGEVIFYHAGFPYKRSCINTCPGYDLAESHPLNLCMKAKYWSGHGLGCCI